MSPHAVFVRRCQVAAALCGVLLAAVGPATAARAGLAPDPRPDSSPTPSPSPTPEPAGLARPAAEAEAKRLWQTRLEQVRADPARAAEVEGRRIELDGLKMPFAFKVFGAKPARGRSLYLSMHGGGSGPARMNDRQYENQQKLYEPKEGVYLAPRAPTNTWDLWHQAHIDKFFAHLILDMVAFEGVDPDRVYLMGYSAGGDGVYQVAPRLADRFAAAAMMAGHPNESKPLGLRNLPFILQVGANDAAYQRNEVARRYGAELDLLERADGAGAYVHDVEIRPGKAHWMDREDAMALPWMARFARNPAPKKVVWYQDDVTHDRFYWLAVPPGTAKAGATVVAEVVGQEVRVERAEGVDALIVRLDDRLLDLDRPVTVTALGRPIFEGKLPRTAATLARTLAERDDPGLMFPAELTIPLQRPAPPPAQ